MRCSGGVLIWSPSVPVNESPLFGTLFLITITGTTLLVPVQTELSRTQRDSSSGVRFGFRTVSKRLQGLWKFSCRCSYHLPFPLTAASCCTSPAVGQTIKKVPEFGLMGSPQSVPGSCVLTLSSCLQSRHMMLIVVWPNRSDSKWAS